MALQKIRPKHGLNAGGGIWFHQKAKLCRELRRDRLPLGARQISRFGEAGLYKGGLNEDGDARGNGPPEGISPAVQVIEVGGRQRIDELDLQYRLLHADAVP